MPQAWPLKKGKISVVDLQCCANFCCTAVTLSIILPFLYYLPSWPIPKDWTYFPVLLSRTGNCLWKEGKVLFLLSSILLLETCLWSCCPQPSETGAQRPHARETTMWLLKKTWVLVPGSQHLSPGLAISRLGFCFCFCFCFCFLGPHLQHMDAPRLGWVELELQLPATATATATATQDPWPTEWGQGSNPSPHGY